ncbi:hypothetical protein AS159_09465 [Thermotoga sp. Ku-13t]|uniref:YfcC family protein n=1 Tax=Thermotoga sp. Ku-13t TaxID=1755813 RepID=UPI0013EC2387|nr:YfcC family protein [Thermotoga sp. Ku-13t]KAF2957245.1 hypothetical protein AS159_09465 [Thermotoga sp. Ku-13t]
MQKSAFSINRNVFISSFLILFVLLIVAGFLTRVLPTGIFERHTIDGKTFVDFNSYRPLETKRLPIYRWFTAPIEVLLSPDGPRIVALLLFLLVVGGSFSILHETSVLNYAVFSLIVRFKNRKNLLIAMVTLVFMLFGSMLGLFEEVVPFVPIVVQLSLQMGWDEFLGLGMSILAAGFGFSAATFNPFTVLLAQSLAGLPAFSGLLFRILIFVAIYLLLICFLLRYSKRFDRNASMNEENIEAVDSATRMAFRSFVFFVILMITVILISFFFRALQTYLVPVITLIYLLMGFFCGLSANVGFLNVLKIFSRGLLTILPSTLLIMLAASIKHVVEQGMVMDTILYRAVSLLGSGQLRVALMVYLIVLALNFFIPSASAKAFLLMPLLVPIAQLTKLSRQTLVLSFTFGDGFSNMIFPTNPVLLISLSLANFSYFRWFKKTVLLQIFVFLVTVIFLIVAVLIEYGPF